MEISLLAVGVEKKTEAEASPSPRRAAGGPAACSFVAAFAF
ncbi:hypothetical protein [Methylocella sp.]